MRRSVPSPFGTSLIDLLVGALAMVALLWAMNAGNSGLSGTGDEDRSSGIVVIDQYGFSHIVTLELGQARRWKCEFTLDWKTRSAKSDTPDGPCKGEPGHREPIYTDDGSVTLAGGNGRGEPPRVRWRLDRPPEKRFMASLVIEAENVSEADIEAEIGIAPCCATKAPHYLRVLALSGAGKDEWFAFWHEAGKLRRVLTKKAHDKPWINSFRKSVKDGVLSPRLVAFDANGRNCVTLQRNDPAPKLKVVFEAEGDVRFVLPPKPASGTDHVTLASEFDHLLARYAGGPPP